MVNEEDCVARILKEVAWEDGGHLPGELTGTINRVGISRVWKKEGLFASTGERYVEMYQEIGFNAFKLYLQDKSRGVTIEIDLLNNVIKSSQNGNPFGVEQITAKGFHPGGA